MAKTSKVNHNQLRAKLCEKFSARREELRKRSLDMKLSLEERMEARAALALLPRNSSTTRIRNRCGITGRSRAYNRRLGICRNMVRDLAHMGVLPGLKKASW
jgi:small subunit ribosomal protein S14